MCGSQNGHAEGAMEAIGLSARLGLTGLCAFLDFSPPWTIQHYETCDMWNHLIVTCNMKQCNKGAFFYSPTDPADARRYRLRLKRERHSG